MNKEPKAETKRCAMVRNSWKGLFLKNGAIFCLNAEMVIYLESSKTVDEPVRKMTGGG